MIQKLSMNGADQPLDERVGQRHIRNRFDLLDFENPEIGLPAGRSHLSPPPALRPDGSSGVDIYYVHTDQLNTPRRITRPSDSVIVWRWDSEPYGATPADEDPDGDMQTSRTT